MNLVAKHRRNVREERVQNMCTGLIKERESDRLLARKTHRRMPLKMSRTIKSVFTSTSELMFDGDGSETLTPSRANIRQSPLISTE